MALPTNKKVVEEERSKLDKLVYKSERTLLTVSAVFPFDFFPDQIIIDENKVQIVTRRFFIEEHIFPILVSTINSVAVITNLFFASIIIEIRGYETNPEPLQLLKHKDALRAKRIILGLMTCQKEEIDLSKLSVREILEKVEKVGQSRDDN